MRSDSTQVGDETDRPVAIVDRIRRLLAELAVGEFEPDELRSLLRAMRALQAAADGVICRIGQRSDALAQEGKACPAAEFLLDDGAVVASTARQEARRADSLRRFPTFAPGVRAGSIGGDTLDALARRTRPLTDEQAARLPIDRVLRDALRLPADTFDAGLRRRVDAVAGDAGLGDTNRLRTRSEFRHWFDHRSGLGRFHGSLDPERYEALTSAVDRHVATLAAGADDEPMVKDANLAAEALVQLVTHRVDHRASAGTISVVVDHRTLAEGPHDGTIARTGDGHRLAPASVARLCCDATLRRVVLDDRQVPIAVGRRHRTATAAQWDAIRTVRSHCAWPGCRLPLRWTQLHHILEWERGGPTDLDNLVPLCHRHHHRVHEGRWRIRLGPGRTVSTYLPDGSLHRTERPDDPATDTSFDDTG